MEQLKPILDGMKKHWFWIFCGVTLVACAVVYYFVSSDIAAKEKESITKIETTKTKANALKSAGVELKPKDDDSDAAGNGGGSQTEHPNEKTLEAMKVVVKSAAVATAFAWKTKHATQTPYQVFNGKEIGEPNFNFRKLFPAEAIKFESVNNLDIEEELIPLPVRINYGEKIKNVLPNLAAITRSQWKPNFEKSEPYPSEVIIWKRENQEFWHDRFTKYKNNWNVDSDTPYTLQILYTTEDLWILKAVLTDIVGKTVFDKGDIYANDLAAIRQIDHILIGKIAESDEASRPASSAASSSSGGSAGMSSSSMDMGAGGGAAAGNTTKKKGADSEDPIEGRYVDAEGNDIPAKDYRAIYESDETDRKKIPWKIAKRVKIRIGLQMDSRAIPELLANCANSTFPLEVRKLRVNLHKASSLSGGGGSGAMSGGGAAGGDDRLQGPSSGGGGGAGASAPGGGSGSGSGMGGSGGKAGKQQMAMDDEGYTKPVEIYGFIYVYNKVDDSLFKILDEESNKTNPTP